MTLCTFITSWFCGNESKKIIPLKMLWATEIKNKKERYKLSKMKRLMAAVKTGAEQLGIWQDQRGSWDVGLAVWLYESVNHLFKYPSKMSKINWDIR